MEDFNWTAQAGALALFAAGLFLIGGGAWQLSGFFPAQARPERLRGGAGAGLVYLGLAALLALVAAAARLAWLRLDWAPAVIVGGLALLAAPLAFQAVPRSFRDDKGGLALLVLLSLAVTAGMTLI